MDMSFYQVHGRRHDRIWRARTSLNLPAEQALAERQRRGLVITSRRAPWQGASSAATGI
jgi:hypothetical protein